MNKKMKFIIISLSLILLLLAALLYFAGNYFYNLAINPNTDKSIVIGEPSNDEESGPQEIAFAELTKQEKFKEMIITSEDNLKLHGYEFGNEGTNWILLVHGYMGEAADLILSAKHFHEQGYNVLMPDLRGHGKSEGSYIGMGYDDSKDIMKWIQYITGQNTEAKIVLFGVSMGASTVMITTGNTLPVNVKAAIEDCGYTSAWDEFAYQLNVLFHIPAFPILNVSNIFVKARAGFDLHAADALEAVKRSDTPTLFIHGDKDTFVPYEMVHTLYDAAACKKQLLTISGAGHGQSRETDEDTYWDTVDSFIQKYIS